MIGSVSWETRFNIKEIRVATMVLFAVKKVFGLILMAIAIKLFSSNIKELF